MLEAVLPGGKGVQFGGNTHRAKLFPHLHRVHGGPAVGIAVDQKHRGGVGVETELRRQDGAVGIAAGGVVGIQALRAENLLDPSRVMFISFSYPVCEWIAQHLPGFDNQYLEGDKDPETVHASGINGIDYHYSVFKSHPDWVARAHALGMSVNTWTVDNKADMEYVKGLGVDVITTNKPLVLKEVLGL